MKQYITEQMLHCVINNKLFPQDCDITKTIYATFGTYGLRLTKILKNGTMSKFVNDYQIKSADEINEELNAQEWGKD